MVRIPTLLPLMVKGLSKEMPPNEPVTILPWDKNPAPPDSIMPLVKTKEAALLFPKVIMPVFAKIPVPPIWLFKPSNVRA